MGQSCRMAGQLVSTYISVSSRHSGKGGGGGGGGQVEFWECEGGRHELQLSNPKGGT